MDFQVVELDKKTVDNFWHLRKELLLELGEITTETDVEELESASKKYYLERINWRIYPVNCWLRHECGQGVFSAYLSDTSLKFTS